MLSYVEMMRRYAEVAGLTPRVIVKVPVLTPGLSSLWVGLVTPVPANLARPLVESLRNEVVCSEHDIAEYPGSARRPADPRAGHHRGPAVHARGRRLHPLVVGRDAGAPSDPLPTDPSWAGGSLYVDARNSGVRASPAALWRVIEGIGGETGWYSFPAAWAVRGCSTGSPAGSDCAAAAATPGIYSPATPWISGGWRRSSRESCCGCARR